ncbi:MAG: hypothetical protein ABIE74_09440 [Pseudomonadota bacterium]
MECFWSKDLEVADRYRDAAFSAYEEAFSLPSMYIFESDVTAQIKRDVDRLGKLNFWSLRIGERVTSSYRVN